MKKVIAESEHDEPNCFVFLDLEETIIDTWQDGNILGHGVDRICEFINGKDKWFQNNTILAPATPLLNMKLGLMSWAVWDHKDKEAFNTRFRPHLEQLLDCKFDDRFVLSMDDWAQLIFRHFNKKFSRQDLFDIFSKPEVLFALARTNPDFHKSTVFLIDDAYEHLMTFKSPRNKCHVEIRNINNM